ncbi:hypothetical protein [Streptomyces sp. 6N223]|uniref:hypothetical protein n=1 Tax=Streptomyces sp. 6N223 TaxID=3457412 RepID=UPI003FD11F59
MQRAARRASTVPAGTPAPAPTIQRREAVAPPPASPAASRPSTGGSARQSRQGVEPDASPPLELSEAQLEKLVKRLIPRLNRVSFSVDELTGAQLDELAHRLIGRITRLLRAELRLDRERIGRLRDTRR